MAPIPPPTLARPTKSTTCSLTSPYRTPHRITKSPLKRSKLHSKRSALLSRLHNSSTTKSSDPKRRRPSKKLVTNLNSLADALPPATPPTTTNANSNSTDPTTVGTKVKKIAHKSLKSRPGASRKKEKILAMERERFGRNLAEMAKGSGDGSSRGDGDKEGMVAGTAEVGSGSVNGSKERWAAIRGFIKERMEMREG